MRRLLVIGGIVVVAAVVGVAIAIAATGGSSGSQTAGGTVSAKKLGSAGTVLVDSKGRALYRSEQERKGMVLCTGACLSFWRPLTVKGTPKGHSLQGTFGVVKRPDGGGRQVTYNGKLLYSFKLDTPGQVKGDGFKDAFGGQKFRWHVVHPVGTSSSGSTKPMPTPPPTTVPGY